MNLLCRGGVRGGLEGGGGPVGRSPLPLQGAQPMPSHRPPDGKCQLSMAPVTDSNRPQPLRHPPPTACTTTPGAASEVPSLLMHPPPRGGGAYHTRSAPPSRARWIDHNDCAKSLSCGAMERVDNHSTRPDFSVVLARGEGGLQ